MKKAIYLLLLTAIVVGAGALWVRQSVYYALYQFGEAAEKGDVATVEKYLDLNALVEAGAVYTSELAKVAVKDVTGNNFLGKIADALTQPFVEGVAKGAGGKAELRKATAEGELLRSWSVMDIDLDRPYVIAEDVGGAVVVTVYGVCKTGSKAKAEVDFVFTRVPGPFGINFLGHPRATSLREKSVRKLARDCGLPAAPKQKG